MDERRCRCLLSAYDLDSSGKLETEEFVTWMMLEYVKVGGGREGGGEGCTRLIRPGRAVSTVKLVVAYALFRGDLHTVVVRAKPGM